MGIGVFLKTELTREGRGCERLAQSQDAFSEGMNTNRLCSCSGRTDNFPGHATLIIQI